MAASTTNPPCERLRVAGDAIVTVTGERIVLKGTALGGYLNMENFITGYAGHEHEHRSQLSSVLGKQKADFFFERFLHYFFAEADVEFFASLGMNCIRLPFNYRYFIDDQNSEHYKEEGFSFLDRVVNICAKYNLAITKALFWDFRLFQDQAIQLWEVIAAHYKDNPVVCGYNLLNEPADPQHTRLISWYERAEKAIRAVDPATMLFIDGNTYPMDFSHFETTLPNSSGTDAQKSKLRKSFERKVAFMREKKVPIWNGEFGPVYADERVDPEATKTNDARFHMLKEQLNIYHQDKISWSIWLYKDIGYQGMVYVNPNTPYMQLIDPFVSKKQKLALDFWGFVDKEGVHDVYNPFIEGLKKMVLEHLQKKRYPFIWDFQRHVERVVRETLMSEYLGWEFAELFVDKSEDELEELAKSLSFENCVKRDGLNVILQADRCRVEDAQP
ncbi:glycoside hydrolase superfamily [Phaeosphaeria sp. MPI-PUGE-AT-0046c]|nr:glycoside hydrolase superfamily [Phaeosphaeria sp. MPI-PUGE-AT-0046c]